MENVGIIGILTYPKSLKILFDPKVSGHDLLEIGQSLIFIMVIRLLIYFNHKTYIYLQK